ncbi:MAG: DUF6691 family protein [Bacteroidota bacterium]
MKFVKFLFVGLLFGIILTKSEVISWYRIYEMFRFQSFHMYGVIGSAVAIGILTTTIIKSLRVKDYNGKEIELIPKAKGWKNYLFGGIIFGLGWAMTGACPGPIYVLIGNGFSIFVVVFVSAVFGTVVYGLLRNKLPH